MSLNSKGFKIGIIAAAVVVAIAGGTYYTVSSKVQNAYNDAVNLVASKVDGVTLISKKTNFGLFGGTAVTKYRMDPKVTFSVSNDYNTEPVFIEAITTVNSSNPFEVKSTTNFDLSGGFFKDFTNELLGMGLKFTMNNQPFSITDETGNFKLPLVVTTINKTVLAETAGIEQPGKLTVSPINVEYRNENNQERINVNMSHFDVMDGASEFKLGNLSLKTDDLLNIDSKPTKYAKGNSVLKIGKLYLSGDNKTFSLTNAALSTNYKVDGSLADMGSTLTLGTLSVPNVNAHNSRYKASNIKIKADLSGVDYQFWDELSNLYSKAVVSKSNTQLAQWLQNNKLNLSKAKVKEFSFSGDFAQGNVKGNLTADLNDSVTNVRFDNLNKTLKKDLILDFTASLPMTMGEDMFNQYELQNLMMKNVLAKNGDRLESHIKVENGLPEFLSKKS